MAILTMPVAPGFQAARFVLQVNTETFVSPLSRTIQRVDRLGPRWLATYTLPPMRLSESGPWEVFLARLAGRAGRFYAGDPSGVTPRGSALGMPVVAGAGQTGDSLLTGGWIAGQAGVLLAGDYVAWTTPTGWRELHKVTVDANSDASGGAILVLAPRIRESPLSGEALVTSGATGIMALATDEEGAWETDEAQIVTISFSGEEALADSYA